MVNRKIECDYDAFVKLRTEIDAKYISLSYKLMSEGKTKGSRKEQMISLRQEVFKMIQESIKAKENGELLKKLVISKGLYTTNVDSLEKAQVDIATQLNQIEVEYGFPGSLDNCVESKIKQKPRKREKKVVEKLSKKKVPTKAVWTE